MGVPCAGRGFCGAVRRFRGTRAGRAFDNLKEVLSAAVGAKFIAKVFVSASKGMIVGCRSRMPKYNE